MDLILGVAGKDERIRAVYMNGSRTNPQAPRDIFQDYDIVYVVTETESFIRDEGWIDVFGPRLMLQEPEKNSQHFYFDEGIPDLSRNYGYLMLFADGNRIDLHVQTLEASRVEFMADKLTVLLLDKDHCLPEIPPATDIDYRVKPPSAIQFAVCCNEFWWCLQNVAKGIWRDELPYAKRMFDHYVRDMLDQMVSWRVGIEHDFEVSAGKLGKYFKQYLPAAHWEMYVNTYADGSYEHFWEAVDAACGLFRTLAGEVSAHFGFTYRYDEDQGMTLYLQAVRRLPQDAGEILPE